MSRQDRDSNSVRPAERTPRHRLAMLLSVLRRLLSGDRFERLYSAVREQIQALDRGSTRLLDYGCGSMDFSMRLKEERVIADFMATDIYPPPPAAPDGGQREYPWSHYRQITDTSLADLREAFDVAIVVDVLHHADEEDQAPILAALARSCRHVIVKDHFEYGPLSRQILRSADWFGNFAYGVRIPDRYFDPPRWDALVRAADLVEVRRVRNVVVHGGLFGILLPARHHFIAVLCARAPRSTPPERPTAAN